LSGFGEISAEKGKQPIKIKLNQMLGTKVSAAKVARISSKQFMGPFLHALYR
jgi:hypothetical protein